MAPLRHRPGRLQGVPVVWRGDQHCIEPALSFEQHAKIFVKRQARLRVGNRVARREQCAFVHIAQRRQPVA